MLAIWLALVSLVLPLHAERMRFVVVGDTGFGTEIVAKGIARIHAAEPLDAIVMTGDNVYPCGVKSASDPKWAMVRPLAALGVPLYPVLGNHDHCGNADAQIDAPIPNWHFPAREYTLRTPLAEFLFLDTTPVANGKRGPPPMAFSDLPWRIVVGHHTVASSGYHGYLPRDEHAAMQKLLFPMRVANVDLYLCGHDHHLELLRTNPIMLISGAGSSPVVPVLRHRATLFPDQLIAYRGFAVVELTPKTMTIRFYDAAGEPRSKRFDFPKN